ncbi:MAG: hypothetical protein Q9219_002292 [cf. Caloplaca sp. 3 TL-2023]
MAGGESLHDRIRQLAPSDIFSKPTTIVIAVLDEGVDVHGDIQQEDFIWIKCSPKTAITQVREQVRIRRQISYPWTLTTLFPNEGKVLGSDLTVGQFKGSSGEQLVVFQIGKSVLGQVSSPQQASSMGNPLSPKDANPRVQPSVSAKRQSGRNFLSPSPGIENISPFTPPAGHMLQNHPSPGSSNNATPSYPMQSSSNPSIPQSSGNHLASTQSFNPGLYPSLVKTDVGHFPQYYGASIRRLRLQHPKADEGEWDCISSRGLHLQLPE